MTLTKKLGVSWSLTLSPEFLCSLAPAESRGLPTPCLGVLSESCSGLQPRPSGQR